MFSLDTNKGQSFLQQYCFFLHPITILYRPYLHPQFSLVGWSLFPLT
nr:MAG TPA: hypothetical protein [Caudoviricetes sp.]